MTAAPSIEPWVTLVECRSGIRAFVLAVREGRVSAAERDAAVAVLRRLASAWRGRLTLRAGQALADVDAALAHFAGGGTPETLPPMTCTKSQRRPKWRPGGPRWRA